MWAMTLAPGVANGAVITGIRVGEHPAATRVVIDLTSAVTYRVYTLAGPDRVVIDLPLVEWRVQPHASALKGGLITGIRSGRVGEDTWRIILDMAAPVSIKREFALPPQHDYPHRLVIDLAAREEASAHRAEPERVNGRDARLPAKRPDTPKSRIQRTVVLDPGHGGADPGAISPAGIFEKDLTLAVGLELRRRLLATGRYRVVMTRETDDFVKLRDRVARARHAGGDLFLSLHADSIGNSRLRGASVYTLSETASDDEAGELAERENRADIIAGVDLSGESDVVSGILIDLAQRETMNLSAEFANQLISELSDASIMLKRSRRYAGFAVLKAPDMPAVLVELGYLSNPRDERMLVAPKQRAPLVEALLRGIDTFFDRE
jgi:N-acetylmuramoyl-L-alanine amidase